MGPTTSSENSSYGDKSTDNEYEAEVTSESTSEKEITMSNTSHFEGVTSKYSLTVTVLENESVSNISGHTMSQPTEVVGEFFHFSKSEGSTFCETCEGRSATSNHRGTGLTEFGSRSTESEQQEFTTTGTAQSVKKKSETSLQQTTVTSREIGVTTETRKSAESNELSNSTENKNGDVVNTENSSESYSKTTANEEYSKNASHGPQNTTTKQSDVIATETTPLIFGNTEKTANESETTINAEGTTSSLYNNGQTTAFAASESNVECASSSSPNINNHGTTETYLQNLTSKLKNKTSTEGLYMLSVTEPPNATTGAAEVIESDNEAPVKSKQHDKNDKPLVVVINNSGNKHEKLNDSFIEDIINKPLSDVELQVVDLQSISKETLNGTKLTGKSGKEHKVVTCSKSDYDSNNGCLCNIDNYVTNLENKLKNNVEITEKDLECNQFFSVHEGIVVSNTTKPTKRKKRSLMFLTTSANSNKVIEKDSIQDVIGEDYKIPSTDSDLIVLPGSTVNIPCQNADDNLSRGLSTTFTWSFKKDVQRKGEILANTESSLQLQNVEAKRLRVTTLAAKQKMAN
ncbi:unnamed protein product [Callosobruchus maculatus]|uniref:Uncharacterized protein n=1 Tax=Callosobruchus maculatus TaxID=64391 RepID=A0A653BQB9_CALMS|nr:unnamed protein product [Callosobruchus maculatus]